MATILSRLKISTKIVFLLFLLGAVVLAVAVFGSRSLQQVNDRYSVLVDSKLPVTTKMARINRLSTQMVYYGYQAMAYPGGSAEGKAAVAGELNAFKSAEQLIEEIKKIDPSAEDEARELKENVAAIHKAASEAIRLGVADQNEAARAILMDLDDKLATLTRRIAERGRYPAIDILKSVSRTLPHCHTQEENRIRLAARRVLSTYGDMEEMVRLGAYKAGSNAEVDEAIRQAPHIEELLKQGKSDRGDAGGSFAALAEMLELAA